MHRRLTALLLLLATVVIGIFIASTATAAGSVESDFANRITAARRSARLPSYAVRADLSEVARRWAARMASNDRLEHNPNLSSDVRNWRAVGENVGQGATAAAIHDAFMDSPSHRANILDRDFTEMGIGTIRGADGTLWVVEVFRLPASNTVPSQVSVPTTRSPVRATRSAPRPTVKLPRPVRIAGPARPAAPLSSVGAVPRAIQYFDVMSALGS